MTQKPSRLAPSTMYLVGDEKKVIKDRSDLVHYFSDGAKPSDQWRVGTEHEMIGVLNNGLPIPYENGLGALLDYLDRLGWETVREQGNVIGLLCAERQISIEPGGQLEHAVRPLFRGDELEKDLYGFLGQIKEPSEELGLNWLSIGFRPWGGLSDVSWMPKQRYDVMRRYLPLHGGLANEMMKRTATVQVNVDYSDSHDAYEKLRAASLVTPLLTAMYANSPVVNGELNGYQSYRSHVWTDTDSARCGILPFLFEDVDVFEAYTDWALDVPMFFVYRDGYNQVSDLTFRRFWREGYQGTVASMDDWGLHLSTLFPDVRMKKFIEIRGCDAGSIAVSTALGSLCKGFLYDKQAREDTLKFLDFLTYQDVVALQKEVSLKGLRATLRNTNLQSWAMDFLNIAKDGLTRLDKNDVRFLDPLSEIVESGRSQADRFIDLWQMHQGQPGPLIQSIAYDLKGKTGDEQWTCD